MQNNTLLSVVIPIYNREKTLSVAVDSVLKADSDTIEVLLIDDGSTDNSGAICDKFAERDKRVKVFHKENGGVSSARNVGIDNACGKYILFCDSDDQVYSDVLEKSLSCLSDSDMDLYIFDYVYHNLNDESEVTQKFDISAKTDLKKQDIVDKIIAPLVLSAGTGLAPLWHKFFLTEKIKKFNISFEEKVFKGEDWRFVLDFADIADSAYYVPETLYRYNLDGTQTEKKYKRIPGYHLLGSPKRKLSLLEKYNLSDAQHFKASIYKSIIDDIIFSSQKHCGKKELLKMKNDHYTQAALFFIKKMGRQEFFKYEISRKYKIYAYLISAEMFRLLSVICRG